MDNFVAVAASADVRPGGMLRVYAHATWIVLVNLENEYFAIADTCTHEEASLYKGVFKDGCIRCPLHGSRFNVRTGKPLEEPAEVPVAVYPVKIVDGTVYLGPA